MKVCIVAEGCYPYVVGGVSSWINSMIKAFPDIEFVVLAIVANRSYRGKFVYELPENVSEVYELYLEDYDWVEQEKNKKLHLRQNEYEALRSLLLNRNVEWDTLFTLFEKKNFSLNALLMGEDFLNAVRECYQLPFPCGIYVLPHNRRLPGNKDGSHCRLAHKVLSGHAAKSAPSRNRFAHPLDKPR